MNTEQFIEYFGRISSFSTAADIVLDGILPAGVDPGDTRVIAVLDRLRAERPVLPITPPAPEVPAAASPLRVRVNEELVLDAGWIDDGRLRRENVRVVHPPATAMVEQVLAYLDAKPPVNRGTLPKCSFDGRAGAAAAAVCLRWGTYLSVLADRGRPLWEFATTADERVSTSRIDDVEMARINLEACFALETWVERALAGARSGGFDELVAKAVAYLPMPRRCVTRPKTSPIYGWANRETADMAAPLIQQMPDAPFRLAASSAMPSRVFANSCVNVGWRNGPVEDIHAGRHRGTPLHLRRITPAEERELFSFSAEAFAAAMTVVSDTTWGGRPWGETVQMFNVVGLFHVPSRWSLIGRSWVMELDQRDYAASSAEAEMPN